jgi:molybdate transport system substrate-binding protein
MAALIGFCLAFIVSLSPAAAAELAISSAVSLKSVLGSLVPEFESATGNRVRVILDTSVVLKRKIESGEQFDVAILSQNITSELERDNRVTSERHPIIATTAVALASRTGTPTIRSVEDLKSALLNATSIASSDPKSGGASAMQLQKAIRMFGIEDRIKPKLIFTPGGAAALAVADGRAELAVALTSEIVPVRGVKPAGTFPGVLESKVTLVGSVSSGTRAPAAAAAFLDFLQSSAARAVLQNNGMNPS